MSTPKLILGLLDTSRQIADPSVAGRLRELTIAWSRFKYFGSIVEDDSVDAILSTAMRRQADYCLIQAHGHILDEVWHPDGGETVDVLTALQRWIATHDFLVTGHIIGGDGDAYGLSCRFLLVDLKRYRELGCPLFSAPFAGMRRVARARHVAPDSGEAQRLEPTGETAGIARDVSGWSFVDASLSAGLPVYAFPSSVTAAAVELDAGAAPLAAIRRVLLPHLPDPQVDAACGTPDERAMHFLQRVRNLTASLPRGVFVWNIEGYGDIEKRPEGFEPPIRALYTVAAGFKPNRILETHGFNANTRMVIFDYSRPGLAFRRLLHEKWDGTDYPDFLRFLFNELPSRVAHYVLWEGAIPETVDWSDIEARWQAELVAWGGAQALRKHWRRFRDIRVEYVCCDLLTEPAPLLERVCDDPAAVIWWSNAFFSVHSTWLYTAAYRRAQYREFIDALADRAPDLFLYGADCNNISVNFVQARAYRDWYNQAGGDELEPAKRHRYEIRF
jgi:hypothetical protein